MRIIILLVFLASIHSAWAQKTKTQLHMKNVECDYDTTAKLFSSAEMKVNDDTLKNIVISKEGNHKILHLKVFSVKCDCNDCFESNELAIIIDSLKLNEARYFKASEVIWVYRNSWIKPKYITTYLGNITQKSETDFELKISELLGSTVIRSISLKVKAE